MTNSLTWQQRWELRFRLNLRDRLRTRQARRNPKIFRELVRLPRLSGTFADHITRWQARDFAALDPGWQTLAGVELPTGSVTAPTPRPIRRAYLERPRGHSKTSDTALQLAWILLFATRPVHGLAAAADRDQASLITEALAAFADVNPAWCEPLRFRKHTVEHREIGSRLDVISSDVASSWGLLPDFVVCDELCHWDRPDLWHSLLSSAAKRPDCLLVVLTNAGVGRGWTWEVRETARTHPDWHFSTLDGPQAPWLDPHQLAEQQALLPPPVYERLWNNRWQHSDGEFVTLAEAEACRDPQRTVSERGEPGIRYVAAVDYAEKHDLTVGTILHTEGDLVIVDRMDLACPAPGSPVPVSWVENWIREMTVRFPGLTTVIDEYQTLGLIQQLQTTHDLRRFRFAGGQGNHALAVTLRQLIVNGRLRWPVGIGQRPDMTSRDDLETELASLLLKQKSDGRIRIDHRSDGQHHDDRAFTLGAACLHLLEQGSTTEWMHMGDGLL